MQTRDLRALVLAFVYGLTAAVAQARPVTPIPPNCTLDPFTGKMNCHLPPNCTLNPFTGEMTCHPPVKADRRS